MFAIYSPTSLEEKVEEKIEVALARDRARVAFMGNDGEEAYVIVEATNFKHMELLEQKLKRKLLTIL